MEASRDMAEIAKVNICKALDTHTHSKNCTFFACSGAEVCKFNRSQSIFLCKIRFDTAEQGPSEVRGMPFTNGMPRESRCGGWPVGDPGVRGQRRAQRPRGPGLRGLLPVDAAAVAARGGPCAAGCFLAGCSLARVFWPRVPISTPERRTSVDSIKLYGHRPLPTPQI